MNKSSFILSVSEVSKSFPTGAGNLQVLRDISFQLTEGESLALTGPSGSGKTTLLGLCAGLEKPSEGEVSLMGQELGILNEEELAKIRRESIGFVFQNFQLIPTLTALENVLVPMELQRHRNVDQKGKDMLSKVGLGKRLDHYPVQLSGGEQQRVALARAFAKEPSILFADEPTGNLDGATSDQIEALLFELNSVSGTSLVIVTHDMNLAKLTDRQINLERGKIVSDFRSKEPAKLV